MLVSGVQQSDSVIHYIYYVFFRFFSIIGYRLLQDIEYSPLCYITDLR